MKIALFQPDNPGNVGAILRLGACFAVTVEIIGPVGFPFDRRIIRRVALDYIDHVNIQHYATWKEFLSTYNMKNYRIILLSTKAAKSYDKLLFSTSDTILLGQESAGVPSEVHSAVDESVRIPLDSKTRSLNVTSACAIVLGEALRQTSTFPGEGHD